MPNLLFLKVYHLGGSWIEPIHILQVKGKGILQTIGGLSHYRRKWAYLHSLGAPRSPRPCISQFPTVYTTLLNQFTPHYAGQLKRPLNTNTALTLIFLHDQSKNLHQFVPLRWSGPPRTSFLTLTASWVDCVGLGGEEASPRFSSKIFIKTVKSSSLRAT